MRALRRAGAIIVWLAAAFAAGAMALPPDDAAAPVDGLRPGEFVWHPEAALAGPLLLVVSVVEQRAYLYRNGVRIAVSTVSTGKPGHDTPAGVYTVLQKRVEHYSNLYDNAPMPYMQRLSWSGLALHAGRLPGYPDSHGCVRLPDGFARRLFEVSALGMTVVVADSPAQGPDLMHPGWLAPAVPGQGAPASPPPAAFWDPERSPAGPVTLLVSTSARSIRVLRNGVEIGRSPFRPAEGPPRGLRILPLRTVPQSVESVPVPGWPRLDMTMLVFPAAAAAAPGDDARIRLQVPTWFARRAHAVLGPGTTVVITHDGIGPPTGPRPPLESAPVYVGD